MFPGKSMRGPGIDKQTALGMRNIVSGEHVASLSFRATGLANVQRVVVAATCHELLTDPAVDQRLERFHDGMCRSLSLGRSSGP